MIQNLTHWASIAARSAFSCAAAPREVGIGLVLRAGLGEEGVALPGRLLIVGLSGDAVDGTVGTDAVKALLGAPDALAAPAASDVHPAAASMRKAPHRATRHRTPRRLVI